MFPRVVFQFLRHVLPGVAAALALALAACGGDGKPKTGKPLGETDKAIMKQYDDVRAALAQDDLRRVRLAAERLRKAMEVPGISPIWDTKALNAAKALEQLSRLDGARAAFRELSTAAAALCENVEGYYVFTGGFTSPDNWVQTTKEPGNPYAGRAMAGYGELKK